MSDRYIPDRFLPDKAIDLIDEAASRIKMELDSKPEQMDKLDRRIIQLKMEKMHVAKAMMPARTSGIDRRKKSTACKKRIRRWTKSGKQKKAASSSTADIKKQMDDIKVKIEQAKRQGDFARAIELEYGELPKLGAQLQAAEE